MLKNIDIITLLVVTILLHLIVGVFFGLIIKTITKDITLPVAIVKSYIQTIIMFVTWIFGLLFAFTGIFVSRSRDSRNFMWSFVGIFVISAILFIALISSIYAFKNRDQEQNS